MNLTDVQFRMLRWLEERGGRAHLKGARVVSGEHETNTHASLPFLNLVAKGFVEGKFGFLVITEKGRRAVRPFRGPAKGENL